MSALGEAFSGAVLALGAAALYGREHGATVHVQNSDGTLELTADDADIGSLSSVPLKVGLPGVKVIVDEGQRVRLAFEASDDYPSGDPRRPFASGLDMDPAADKGVARVDDPVDCGTLTGIASPGGGPVTFTWIPPSPPHIPVIGSSISLAGVISGGSAKVVLRGG